MKDKKAHEYDVPPELVKPLRRYLGFHRPNPLQKKSSKLLWSFQHQLAALTFREFGEALRPHAFRHIAATTVAIQDPEHVSIIADVLGHATLAMSHYNRARGVEANASYQEIMQSIGKQPSGESVAVEHGPTRAAAKPLLRSLGLWKTDFSVGKRLCAL